MAMSTSFQPAEWDYNFLRIFRRQPLRWKICCLNTSGCSRCRKGVPQKADQSWDFTMLNAIFDPVIGVSDKSPELQLATAPAWMDDSDGSLLTAHFADFAAYSADMVSYYNTPTGFRDTNGMNHVHSALTPITYWGIFNEPNFNNIEPDAIHAALQHDGSADADS